MLLQANGESKHNALFNNIEHTTISTSVNNDMDFWAYGICSEFINNAIRSGTQRGTLHSWTIMDIKQ